MPVTRPVACSQIGRQPISAKPLRDLLAAGAQRGAAPEVDDDARAASRRGVCRCARTTSSAASRPRSIAVGVGSVRGSAVKRLRPVGSTSRRPRAGEPAGPGATRRPSSAASSAARSASALCAPRRIVDCRRRAAVDVQAVLDGEILEIAQPGIDAAQRLVGADVGRRRRPRARGRLRCAVSTISRASRSRRRRSSPSACAYSSTSRSSSRASPASPPSTSGGGRWPMVTRGDAALGLRRLARIADDERIDRPAARR